MNLFSKNIYNIIIVFFKKRLIFLKKSPGDWGLGIGDLGLGGWGGGGGGEDPTPKNQKTNPKDF